MKEKVYCKFCKHYQKSNGICVHPNNLSEKDDWYEPKKIPKDHPSIKNSTNDCPDYEEGRNFLDGVAGRLGDSEYTGPIDV